METTPWAAVSAQDRGLAHLFDKLTLSTPRAAFRGALRTRRVHWLEKKLRDQRRRKCELTVVVDRPAITPEPELRLWRLELFGRE